jgi:hypothetical protein
MAARPVFASQHSAIVFELTLDRERTLIELDQNEDRAYVIGASPHADVRVKRPGAPPVAFYLERRANDAWLVPGYRRGQLRVNGAIVVAPCRLGLHSRIEVAGAHIELDAVSWPGAQSSAAGSDEDPPTELSESTRRSRLAYLESLPALDERTRADAIVLATRARPEVLRSPRAGAPAHPARPRDICARSPVPQVPTVPPRRAQPQVPAVPPRRAHEPSCSGKLPHLWTVLEQRPLEAVVFVLLVGLVIVIAAIAAAAVLRLGGSL